jgi:hypothetical protein
MSRYVHLGRCRQDVHHWDFHHDQFRALAIPGCEATGRERSAPLPLALQLETRTHQRNRSSEDGRGSRLSGRARFISRVDEAAMEA